MDDSRVSIESEEIFLNTPSYSFVSWNLLEITQLEGEGEQEEPNIFTNFLEIKQKNESMKANVYAQL